MSDTAKPLHPGLWEIFTAAPHRMMFFGGVFQLVATLVFWSAELIGRYTGLWAPFATTVPATWAHAFLMLYGLFLFFIFGFLMTTYSRWLNGPLVERAHYVTSFLLLFGGLLLFYVGLFTARPIAVLGVGVFLLGWGVGIAALWRVFRLSSAMDKGYERWLNLAHVLGWLGGALYLAWLLVPRWELLQLSLNLGLWLFLVPVFITVAHRMVPFFSYCALPDYEQIQPRWSLPVIWAGLALHALLEYLGATAWTFLVDLPLAAVIFWHSVAWKIGRSFTIRLLAVLHVAIFMFGIALTLFGIRSLAVLMGGADLLGRAPLHMLAIGFLGAMVVGMATRVSLGHSGRELEMDTYNWVCFWGMIAVAVLRALSEFSVLNGVINFNVIAAVGWLGITIAWVARFGPLYLRPRVDGKPG
ncbi:MAG: NnrS family protein [Proteobacteria bacterium]|nr:MAG: NnrS family protein [Pseudomonadota bacterium]QKK11220.1 MAG: NnrS family protein [Pseudomonadota bacterium]